MNSICKCGCRPDPDILDLYPADKTPFSEMVQKIRDNSDGYEWCRYPEEVKMDGIEAQLRREKAKGPIYGHFC